MEEKRCGGCGWFDPNDHTCGNAQTGIFITGESNTAHTGRIFTIF